MKTTTPTLHLMIGGPAAGKSTVRASKFAGLPIVDMDQIQATHPEYDPKAIPSHVHEWASTSAYREFYAALGRGESFVYDSTGTNVEKMVAFINDAHSAGYQVAMTYVQCSLATALRRNTQRARTVPETIVRQKFSTIAVAFDIIGRYADQVQIVNND